MCSRPPDILIVDYVTERAMTDHPDLAVLLPARLILG